MSMKKDTKVLSARVPLDLHKTIAKRAKGLGLSTSAYLTEMVKSSDVPTKFTKGGVLPSMEVPSQMKDVLSAFGGTGVGILVYHLVVNHFPKDKYTKSQREGYGMILGIAGGLLSTWGISSLMATGKPLKGIKS